MARRLEIGNGLQLPLQWMTMSSVVYGTRGSGKSTFGRRIAEEVFNQGQRFCAIDPTGAWWGLKSTEGGDDIGLPVVIFGGDHADVPLEPGAGAELADIVAEIDQPVILDLELLSKTKQIVFIGAFLERLYHINRDPLLLLMDEAQRYAPQKPMSPDSTKTLGATEDIVKLGRKHGLGSVVFTQRGSGLNKEVSELGDVLIAFRTPGVLDQKRIKEWLDANATEDQAKVVLASISGLPTGTAIFASNHPDLKLFSTVAIDRPRSFDSSSTPQVGQRRKEPRILSKPDIDVLNTRMAAAIERSKADDPKELRKKVAELTKTILKMQAEPPAVLQEIQIKEVEKIVEVPVEVPVIDEDGWKTLREASGLLETILASRALGPPPRLEEISVVKTDAKPGKMDEAGAWGFERREPYSKPVHDFRPIELGNEKLGKAERQILAVLQTHGSRTRLQLAFQTGYSPQTSTLGVALGRLRRLELVTTGSPIELTDAGRVTDVGDVEVLPPAGPALAAYWIERLGKAEREILKVMVAEHPDQLSRVELAERTGYSVQTSTLGVALGRLRRLELLDGWQVSPDLIG